MAPPSLVTSELPSTVTKAPPSSVTSALPSTVTRAPPSIVISASPSTVTSAPPSVVLPSTVTRAPPSEMISALPSTVTTARLSVVTSTPPSVMTSSQDYLAEDTEDMHSSDYNTTDADSEEDESSLDTTHKIHKIIVTNSPPDRRRQPIHYYSKQYTSELDQLREEIKRQNEEQKAWMEEKFTEIKKQIELLMASGIARTLTPLLGHPAAYQLGGTTTNAISVSGVNACASVATTVTSPVTATFSNAAAVSTTPAVITPVTAPVEGLVSTCNASETLAAGDLSRLSEPEVVNPEVTVSTENLELIPHADLVKIFTKGKNRPHFAALLVAKLFDEETRLKSNVRGKGKKQKLDPTIIQWVKGKCFEYHPTEGNLQSEWDKCIQAIDTKNRSIKRKQAYRNELSNDQ